MKSIKWRIERDRNDNCKWEIVKWMCNVRNKEISEH